MKDLIWIGIALAGVAFAVFVNYCQAHKEEIEAWLNRRKP